MANSICLSPLKFYDNLEKQNHRKSYAYGHISPLIMPFNTLYPFQFVTNGLHSNILACYLRDKNGDTVASILNTLYEAGLDYTYVGDYRVLVFPGLFPLTDVKLEGEYYLEFIFGSDRNIERTSIYSEIFCFTNSLEKYLEIEYWNPEADFVLKNGVVTFKTDYTKSDFHFKILLCSELGKPEYSYEEEVTKRLGYSFIESQVSKKIYKFNTVVPEYVCDALRLIRLCSNKIIRSKDEEYEMLSFDMDVDWQEQGDLASVNCEFEVDNIIVNLGGYAHEPLGGDFNDDFNKDYKTT